MLVNTELDLKLRGIIQGQLQYKSEMLGFNLLISRLQRKYAAMSTPEVMEDCVKEFIAFFEKYKNVVAKDISLIEKL